MLWVSDNSKVNKIYNLHFSLLQFSLYLYILIIPLTFSSFTIQSQTPFHFRLSLFSLNPKTDNQMIISTPKQCMNTINTDPGYTNDSFSLWQSSPCLINFKYFWLILTCIILTKSDKHLACICNLINYWDSEIDNEVRLMFEVQFYLKGISKY